MSACNEAHRDTSIAFRVVSDMGWLAVGKELMVSVKFWWYSVSCSCCLPQMREILWRA